MEEFTPEDAQTINLPDAEERARLNDPLARLEHDERAKAIAREDAFRMSDLRSDSDARWKDDYAGNKALRRRLRYGVAYIVCVSALLQAVIRFYQVMLSCLPLLSTKTFVPLLYVPPDAYILRPEFVSKTSTSAIWHLYILKQAGLKPAVQVSMRPLLLQSLQKKQPGHGHEHGLTLIADLVLIVAL